VSSPHPVYCPECRSEYLGSATVCVECGVALVGEDALESTAREQLPPVSELVCIRAASVGWAQRLSERLASEGISHRIEVSADDTDDGSVRRPGATLPYGVYVRSEDVEAASRVDTAFMHSQIPDLPGAGAAESDAGDDGEACPACGAALGTDVVECPDCGLVLGVAE
jgi:hypothetical protein